MKLEATHFLISNISGLGSYEGSQLDDYNEVFTILANKPVDYREHLPWYSEELVNLFDSMKSIYGSMDYNNLHYVPDVNAISDEFLIDYINLAFEAWSNPWSTNTVTFSDFCNYVLPYRNFNEPIEDWRRMFLDNYNWIYDSVKGKDGILEVAKMLNVDSELKYSKGFDNYLVSIAPSLLLKAKYGDCSNSSNFKAMIMRSFGIPVAIDFIPIYGSDHNVHFWNSVIDQNGNFVSFEEALNDINASVAYKYRLCKIFRKTYSENDEIVSLLYRNGGDVPSTFLNPRFIDVTSEYVAVSNVNLRLKEIPNGVTDVYLGVFNNTGWTAVDFGRIEGNSSVSFKRLGRETLYLPFYYMDSQVIPAHQPFIISRKGFIQYINPGDKLIEVRLTRKYHMHSRKVNWLRSLKDARFEGANKSDFSDAVEIGKIDYTPDEHFQEIYIRSKQTFAYLRLVFSSDELLIPYDGDGASIAEIEFLSSDGNILKGKPIGTEGRKYNTYLPFNCFDEDPLTFFEDARSKVTGKYVGLELFEASSVSKIRFQARNDMNSIQKNDHYELYFWDNSEFASLGKKVAVDTILIYDNVPENAILWLRNLSSGIEERIFTWKNGKQIFW